MAYNLNDQKRPVAIAVAPVGRDVGEPSRNPITPEDVARETISCARAGAVMVHLHVRDRQGRQTADLSDFATTLDLIREESEIIIQGSTGGICELSLEERCVSLDDPRVEVASLNMGSASIGEGVYINTLPDIRFWARKMHRNGVVPELELFEAGMICNVLKLAEEGVLPGPHHFNLCLGFPGALPAKAEVLFFLRSLLPADAPWGLIHDGMNSLSLAATAIGLGASVVRVGFEDGVYVEPGKAAETNTELVERLVSLVHVMGCRVATPEEARALFGTRK
jgi:3-keto-5-aminohexanoate cleavage enzyme